MVILQLTEMRKSGTHPIEYHRLHAEIQGQFVDHLPIYLFTFMVLKTKAPAVYLWLKFSVRIPNQSSIVTPGAHTLFLEMECVEISNTQT